MPCKPYPMQRLLVLLRRHLLDGHKSNGGLSLRATVSLDKLPYTTEPGLSARSPPQKEKAPKGLFVFLGAISRQASRFLRTRSRRRRRSRRGPSRREKRPASRRPRRRPGPGASRRRKAPRTRRSRSCR